MGIALAKYWQTVIVSADSRQFYKETAIGTAKPSSEEQDGVSHYFVDSHSIHQPLTAAQYEKEALGVLENEFKKHDEIMMVGGSGLFIDALCNGLDDIPHDENVRQQLVNEMEQLGLQTLQEELKLNDPDYYAKADIQNPVRVIRALEVIRISGQTYSSFQAFQPKKRSFKIVKFVIDLPREILYDRINRRVDLMMEAGLLKEVESVFEYRNLQTLNTVGYSELFDFIEGKISKETAIDLIKRNSRRYAKRQLTWFRRDPKAIWISGNTLEEQLKFVLKNA